MADTANKETTKKLNMVFQMDDKSEFKYTLTDPKDGLTRAEAEAAMQKMIDSNAVLKSGRSAASILDIYVTTTENSALA